MFGPKSKDGGLNLTILHRESGAVGSKPFKVSCWVSGDNLYIEAESPDGKSIKFESKR